MPIITHPTHKYVYKIKQPNDIYLRVLLIHLVSCNM